MSKKAWNKNTVADIAEVPITEVTLAERRLPVRKKIGFGIADIGGNLFFTAMGFWTLTYLTDTVYLAPALAGIAIMVAKVWDAVTDPIVGFFSDNTRTRFGRRRPYLLFGALPFGLSLWLFFTKPLFAGAADAVPCKYDHDLREHPVFILNPRIDL